MVTRQMLLNTSKIAPFTDYIEEMYKRLTKSVFIVLGINAAMVSNKVLVDMDIHTVIAHRDSATRAPVRCAMLAQTTS